MLNLLHPAFNSKENVIKLNKNNTIEHELAKALICIEAMERGVDFVSEAVFENGKRADVFLLQDEEAIEIVKTESKKSIEKKHKDYPVDIRALKADYILKVWKERLAQW